MNSKLKQWLCSVTVVATICHFTGAASVLGEKVLNTESHQFAHQTTYTTNTFQSSQQGVGKQTEFYVTYKPNPNVVPVLTNGAVVYGKRTYDQVMSGMQDKGLYPIMAMNGDFFSLQTGVPMSHTILDGKILTKSAERQQAIGFRRDGTAFIAPLQIRTDVAVNGGEPFELENINKYRQPYSIYLLDSRFSSQSRTPDPGKHVIIGELKGSLAINQTITGKVREVVQSEGSIDVPEGCIVLTADNRVPQLFLDQMALFQQGDTVSITNTLVDSDPQWEQAAYGTGCIGGRLLQNGKVVAAADSANPRSAIGIKGDGTIVFYAIDGRQPGYSYGARLITLANRLLELGCVDAVNLDGGGSTIMGGIYPGTTNPVVFNSPSDGGQRAVANYIALLDSGLLEGGALSVQPAGGHYLSGATEQFAMAGLGEAQAIRTVYSVEGGGSTIATDGKAVIRGNGTVTVTASYTGHSASTVVYSHAQPDAITVERDGQPTTGFTVKSGEQVQLRATAQLGGVPLIADNGCFSWTIGEQGDPIGEIGPDGMFTASPYGGQGSVIVRAGERQIALDITVDGPVQEEYPKVAFAQNGRTVIATLSLQLPKKNIEATVDGQPVDVTVEGKEIVLQLPDDNRHKVMIRVTGHQNNLTMVGYTPSGTAYPNPFPDIDGHWGKDYIIDMSRAGVVKGAEEGRFLPNDPMTRAQFAVMIGNYLGIDAAAYQGAYVPYGDVSALPTWGAGHIKALYQRGIITGKTMPNGTVNFDPAATITRAEAVTILCRVLPEGLQQAAINAPDKGDVAPWAAEAFGVMVQMGVVGGYEDGTLRPNNPLARGEAVKLLYQIY